MCLDINPVFQLKCFQPAAGLARELDKGGPEAEGTGAAAMEVRPLHLLLAQHHHPRLPGLLPDHPTYCLPSPRLRVRVRDRRLKRLAAVPSWRPHGSQADAPGRAGWEWAPNAAVALVLQLAMCSLLFLFPSRARALALPPPAGAAAAIEAAQEEEDQEWEAALQKWKTKTYALSVPLRIVALRGSFPPLWIKVRCSSSTHTHTHKKHPRCHIRKIHKFMGARKHGMVYGIRFSDVFFGACRISLNLRARGSNSAPSSVLILMGSFLICPNVWTRVRFSRSPQWQLILCRSGTLGSAMPYIWDC